MIVSLFFSASFKGPPKTDQPKTVTNSTDVYLWAVSTKGSSYLISYEGNAIVPQASNKNAFCETIVLFEQATS